MRRSSPSGTASCQACKQSLPLCHRVVLIGTFDFAARQLLQKRRSYLFSILLPGQNTRAQTPGEQSMKISLTGYELLIHPRLNKGTAFSESERDAFGLHGLLPPHIGTMEQQRKRRKKGLDDETTPFKSIASCGISRIPTKRSSTH